MRSSTMAAATRVAPWRSAVASNSALRAEIVFSSAGRGSAAPMLAPGAMAM